MDASEIFKKAVELQSEHRAAFLETACGNDARLRDEVEARLRDEIVERLNDEIVGRLNDEIVGQLRDNDYTRSDLQDAHTGQPTTDYKSIAELPGTVIGAFKLMELIGEGGFGQVYVAEQFEPIRRKVAIKIIKPGMDTREVIGRFEAERQALALMDHPNIASVFAAGTTAGGRPYFVMELVRGISITKFCDQQRLAPHERLELFQSVCHAVQHAHGKGIIHRDLKPSNILVAPHDGVPVVKVIDFGVAKAIGQQLTDKTVYTRFMQMVGTPLYMSPEQAELNALDVDTRSDVYSLGVLLYELLTGRTPFDRERFASASFDEIRRIIREEEPPRPSTKLSTMGEALSQVSNQRSTDPATLQNQLKGDLDWIVMKALEKERSRRYDTASALAADVRRFLAEEPIEARPPSTTYLLRKFARRNKAALTTASLVAAALLLGTTASIWQAIRATHAESVAQAKQQLAEDETREADAAKVKAEARSEELRYSNYVADMHLARHAWQENRPFGYRTLLNRYLANPGQTDIRGFEWYYLNRLPHQYLLTIKTGKLTPTHAAWTPRGDQLIGFGMIYDKEGHVSGEAKLWSEVTGQAVPLTLEGGMDGIYTGALSPDGKFLVGCSLNKAIRIWDFATGRAIATLNAHKFNYVGNIAFSRDAKVMASFAMEKFGPIDNTQTNCDIRIWNLEKELANQTPVSIDGIVKTFTGVALSPDGKRVAAAAPGKSLKVWDAKSGAELRTKTFPNTIDAAAYSPDGKRLAVSASDDLQILDADSLDCLAHCPVGTSSRSDLTFSPNGNDLAGVEMDNSLRIWNAATGMLRRIIHTGINGDIFRIEYSHDGTRLVACSYDAALTIWDTLHEPNTWAIDTAGLIDHRFGLSPGGRIAVTNGPENIVRLWGTKTGRPATEPIKLEDRLISHDFSPDEKRLVLCDASHNVVIVDPITGTKEFGFKHDGPAWTGLTLSSDGKRLVSSHAEAVGAMTLWDIEKGTALRRLPVLPEMSAFALNPDASRLAVGSQNCVVQILDCATGGELHRYKLDGTKIFDLCYSPDGKWLAATWANGPNYFATEIQLLNIESGQAFMPPFRGTSFLSCFAFSHDSKRLVVGDIYGSLKLWDVATGRETLSLTGHTQQITGLAFSHDGNRLISTSEDLTIRIWDATPVSN